MSCVNSLTRSNQQYIKDGNEIFFIKEKGRERQGKRRYKKRERKGKRRYRKREREAGEREDIRRERGRGKRRCRKRERKGKRIYKKRERKGKVRLKAKQTC